MKKYKINIEVGKLFQFLNLDEIEYDKFEQSNRKVSIDSPSGMVNVNYFVKKVGNVHTYHLANGIDILCDAKHLVKQNDGSFKHIEMANHVLINNQPVQIEGESFEYVGDVYDFSLDDPHEYITTSGIVCHNTTLAQILYENIECEYLYINGSLENGIDLVREKIYGFASTYGFEDLKIVVIDEADYLTPNGQAALRNLMEQFSERVRFIFTCNNIERMIAPIQSRCQVFLMQPPSKREVGELLLKILDNEKIEYDKKDISDIVLRYYPDIRKCINIIQQFSSNGKLNYVNESTIDVDYFNEIVNVLSDVSLKADMKIKQVRQIIADTKRMSFADLYTFLFDNIDAFCNGNLPECIICLDEGQYKETFVVDKQLHISRVLIDLIKLTTKK